MRAVWCTTGALELQRARCSAGVAPQLHAHASWQVSQLRCARAHRTVVRNARGEKIRRRTRGGHARKSRINYDRVWHFAMELTTTRLLIFTSEIFIALMRMGAANRDTARNRSANWRRSSESGWCACASNFRVLVVLLASRNDRDWDDVGRRSRSGDCGNTGGDAPE